MRILLAHNYYRHAGGEDGVFRNEGALLRNHGHEVIVYERRNDEVDDSTFSRRLGLAMRTTWSTNAYREIAALIRRHNPDIAHFHNTFPILSPSVYAACRDHNIPVVQTVHNYRLICPGGLLQREGIPCEDCVGHSLLPALRHRCYRNSLPATAAVAWMLTRNRWAGTYQRLVNRYIALTRFGAGRLVAGGLPRERIVVKPNFLPDAPSPGNGDGYYAVYVGRLSAEKGVATMLSAWKAIRNLPLKIVGDGPLRGEFEKVAQSQNLSVGFLGFQSQATVLNLIRDAVLLILPSQCYEGFPMVILEAYATGTPVVASRLGSMDEVVVDGVTGMKFEAGNPADLALKVNELVGKPAHLTAMRHQVRAVFEQKYTADTNYRQMMGIYEGVLAETVRP